MQKENLMEIFAGTTLIFLILAASVFAQSGSFDLDVQVDTVSTCPTIMQGEPPLNKYDVPIFISNWYDFPDTYEFYLDLPEGWSGFAGIGSSVASGETKQVEPFWITVPDTGEGTFTVTISALSGQTGETVMESFDVNVLSCHNLDLIPDSFYKTVCIETAQPAVYTLTIINKGKTSEIFDISVQDNLGERVPWAEFSDSAITLESGETKTITLTLNPPLDTLGKKELTILAESRNTYANVRENIEVEVVDCFEYESSLHPSENTVCMGRGTSYTLTLSNPKTEDSFRIVTPNWVVPENEYVTLPAGDTANIELTATPREIGELEFDVSIYSTKDPDTVQVIKGTVNSHDCRDVSVSISPEHKDVCTAYPANFTVFVKNLGTMVDTFDITSTFGSLEQTSVTLQPEEIRTIPLAVDPLYTPTEKVIQVVARSGNVSDETSATLTVKNCYSVGLTMDPPETSICPCLGIHYDIGVENVGELADTYTVMFQNTTQEIFLQPGEKEYLNFNFSSSCEMEGFYSPTATVTSDNMAVPQKVSANLTVKKLTDCWSLEMTGGEVEMGPDNVYTVPVEIKNLGENPTLYELSLEGPDWMYLEPKNVSLGFEETEYAYIYISPYYGLEFGNYTALVHARSLHAVSTARIYVEITPEFLAGNATTETLLVMNATTGITLNASLGETETEPTGMFIGIAPTWKTITIGVITIIIIIILVVRFAYLLKV